MRKRLISKMQDYKNMDSTLIFPPPKKILIFFLFLQLKLNIIFKLIIIFINDKENKLNLNFKGDNNMNNTSFKY